MIGIVIYVFNFNYSVESINCLQMEFIRGPLDLILEFAIDYC